MKHTKKKRFTNFRKNKILFSNHINELLKDIKNKIFYASYLSASPLKTNENKEEIPTLFHWEIKKTGKKILFKEGNKIITEFEFKNNLLYLLRKSGIVLLSFNNFTNQKYSDDKREIIELWGYKIQLFWNLVILEKMSSQEILDICTSTVDGVMGLNPEPNIIYCGPDGKIFGWDLV